MTYKATWQIPKRNEMPISDLIFDMAHDDDAIFFNWMQNIRDCMCFKIDEKY